MAEVLATVQAFGGGDPNGCGARVEDDPFVVSDGTMSVCRYDTTGQLEQSELLVGSNAVDAAAALDDTAQADLDCQPSQGRGETIRMFDGDRDVSIELDGACTAVEGRPDGIADRRRAVVGPVARLDGRHDGAAHGKRAAEATTRAAQ